jgi:Protein of unknown function (DUF2934)
MIQKQSKRIRAVTLEAHGVAVPTGKTAEPADVRLEPDHDEIARLAYSYWEARGRRDGSPHEDWFRAEWELRAWPFSAAR